ncbi:MAG: type I secretion C-terminal target domain-containing protein, partial [Alphaproteobacteria bacterium]|nr:type I secretion C-terminal target domain-containing protein [Alphaproteobacteria bacterium]
SQAPGSVSGNVTSNDDIGEDEPGYMVKEISFGGNTVGVPAAGSVTIAGDHGSLTIKADGSYTYTGSTVGADQFTYTIVDQDGDPASATLTVTVSDIDEQPCVENEFIKVDETIVDNAGSQTVNGTLTYDFLGDGPGTINPVAGSFASGGSLKNGALTSNGVAVIVTLVGDTYTGKAGATTIFTLTINDDGSYSYKQFGQLDHADATNPDDVITLNFGFVATDADGDTANGTVVVAVHDDAPVAVNDVATLSQAPGSVSGNVTTNDDIGEDEPGYMVKEISFGGTTVGVPAAGSVTIAGDHGSLTIKADGSYTYTGSTVGADQFTYTIVDQDGDPASATLTVTVARVDQEPTVINSVKAIDETDLGPIVVNGSVNPDYHGDGPGVVTARPVSEIVVSGNAQGGVLSSSGVPVVIALVGNTYIGTAGGKDVFTLTVNADGTYQFTLLDNLDHSIATNHDETLFITFGVTATDADGDSVNGTIKIGIDDDGPVAVDDFASVPASQSTVSGDVDLNDDIGADFTADGVAFVKFGTTTYTVPVGGTVSINGAYGALVIGSNGEYTYTVNPGTTGGQEVFTYTLRDTDQDTATANLVIDVAPRYLPPEPPSVETCDLCVYEDGHAQIQVSTSANGGNGNEVITLSISGFAAGWVVDTSLSGGVYNSATGVWSITLGAGQSFSGGPVVYPPHDSDVDLTNLVVTSSVYDPDSGLTAIANGSFDIIVDAVADQPDLDLHDVFAVGSTFVALQVDVAVTDLDGSEEIKEIRIEGLPDGFSLNQGVYDAGAGRWVLSEDQLNDLQIMAPDGYEGQFTLLVTAVSEEVNLSGEECTTSNNIAYKADVVTVTLYDGACDCYCPPTSTTVITINNTVTVNSFDETIIDGTRSTSTSESSSSSSSTTVVTSTSGGDGSSGFQPIVISDFNKDEGDILDLGGLIDVLDGTSVAIQDFVTSRVENGNTIISMDADGAGGNYIAQDVVVLQGVSDVSVEDVVRLTGHEQNQSGFGTV